MGPTGDGGYYLLGLKKIRDEIFDDVPWSTSKVLSTTLERAEKSKLRAKLLQPLRDVDNIDDWKAIGWRCDEENDSIRNLRRRRT